MKRGGKKFRLIAAIVLLVALLGCTGCQRGEEVVYQEFTQLAPICELATLKCFYHNVAEQESGMDSLFRLGYQKIWIEYSGIVRVGIDASKVTVTRSDTQDDLLRVTIPKAQVLDVDFDENSIQTISERGVFNFESTQVDVEAFNEAQKDMAQTAANDEGMLNQAQERAKTLIENYLQKCGKAIGKTYTIEWIEVEPVEETPTEEGSTEADNSEA